MTNTNPAHGLPFTADMALAIREGRKNQTRRLIEPQPVREITPIMGTNKWASVCDMDGLIAENIICPLRVGDRVFVQEEWWHYKSEELEQAAFIGGTICLLKDGTPSLLHENKSFDPRHYAIWKRQEPRDMPAWAARTWLEITEIRAQRIQEISDLDCLLEGVMFDYVGEDQKRLRRNELWYLWDKIYGAGAWDRNDWVWALTFKVLEGRAG